MAKKSIIISEEVAELIKERRKELGLTIEGAAQKSRSWHKDMESI